MADWKSGEGSGHGGAGSGAIKSAESLDVGRLTRLWNWWREPAWYGRGHSVAGTFALHTPGSVEGLVTVRLFGCLDLAASVDEAF
jgi:hypothetical protein